MKKDNIKTLKNETKKMRTILKQVQKITESIDAGVDERLQWLTNKDFRKKTFEENPECYMVIRTTYGNDLPLVPICNRTALDNPKVILGALMVAKTFLGDARVEQDHLNNIIDRLSKLVGKDVND